MGYSSDLYRILNLNFIIYCLDDNPSLALHRLFFPSFAFSFRVRRQVVRITTAAVTVMIITGRTLQPRCRCFTCPLISIENTIIFVVRLLSMGAGDNIICLAVFLDDKRLVRACGDGEATWAAQEGKA